MTDYATRRTMQRKAGTYAQSIARAASVEKPKTVTVKLYLHGVDAVLISTRSR